MTASISFVTLTYSFASLLIELDASFRGMVAGLAGIPARIVAACGGSCSFRPGRQHSD
jgi:hypothetical protein